MADRLLDHYTARHAKARQLDDEAAAAYRAVIDMDPSWQSRLGRTGGAYEHLRALVLAGVATADERDELNEFA